VRCSFCTLAIFQTAIETNVKRWVHVKSIAGGGGEGKGKGKGRGEGYERFYKPKILFRIVVKNNSE